MEFLAVGVLLLVPLLYLVLCLGRVQAGAFAAEGAAREAARIVAATADAGVAEDRAAAAVALAAEDQGFAATAAEVRLRCSAQPCRTPGAVVRASVRVEVDLPLVPAWVGRRVPARVPVEVVRVAVVDRLAVPGEGP
ncbi:pilus assembly protein [Kineococcus xinjiangensis]|uniref:pilus assembly protein n=1 Tax=Kineococcus xinjiangensis TaxID=512762 RepID=UPI001FE2B5E7|nr:pilus assembly protein [Kineococcus xinjiangensis]